MLLCGKWVVMAEATGCTEGEEGGPLIIKTYSIACACDGHGTE